MVWSKEECRQLQRKEDVLPPYADETANHAKPDRYAITAGDPDISLGSVEHLGEIFVPGVIPARYPQDGNPRIFHGADQN